MVVIDVGKGVVVTTVRGSACLVGNVDTFGGALADDVVIVSGCKFPGVKSKLFTSVFVRPL